MMVLRLMIKEENGVWVVFKNHGGDDYYEYYNDQMIDIMIKLRVPGKRRKSSFSSSRRCHIQWILSSPSVYREPDGQPPRPQTRIPPRPVPSFSSFSSSHSLSLSGSGSSTRGCQNSADHQLQSERPTVPGFPLDESFVLDQWQRKVRRRPSWNATVLDENGTILCFECMGGLTVATHNAQLISE